MACTSVHATAYLARALPASVVTNTDHALHGPACTGGAPARVRRHLSIMGAIGGRDHEAVGSRERRALNIIGDCRAPYHHHTSRIGRIMKLINYDPTRSIPIYKIYVQRVVGHFYD